MLIDHVIGGKYRITELIGQGGMGTVFEAVHNGTGSRVAIKLIVSNDIKEEVFVRFQREARAAGTIDSHHIVRIFDMGTDDRSGSPYMVMERLVGEDLSQLMRRVGPLSPHVACGLIAQATLGLAKAHEAGVVHRDIKPANLFLHDSSDSGEVILKILDFGIAKVLMDVMQRSEEGGLTRTGSMLGSPHYMSPEQAQGLRSIDHRSDIWSLGVVLYKMLCGQTPHAHLSTLGQVILAICSQPSRPIQELAPWVPPDVARIVHRALQPDPNQRFQSAYEMFASLQTVLQGAPPCRRVDIRPLSQTQRMAVPPPVAAYRTDVPTNGTQHGLSQTSAPALPAPRGSALLIAMASLGVLAAIGLAGIGAVVLKKSAHASTGAERTTSASATHVGTAPASPPTGTASNDGNGGTALTTERSVSLAVPPQATVDVDGQRRPVINGAVELKGPLGGVVSVHVVDDGLESTQVVAITEGGAIPPRITPQPARATPAPTTPTTAAAAALTSTPTTAAPRPGKTGAPPATAKATPSAATTTLNAQRTFE